MEAATQMDPVCTRVAAGSAAGAAATIFAVARASASHRRLVSAGRQPPRRCSRPLLGPEGGAQRPLCALDLGSVTSTHLLFPPMPLGLSSQ